MMMIILFLGTRMMIFLNYRFSFLSHFGVCAGMILLNEAPKLTGQTGKRKGMRKRTFP